MINHRTTARAHYSARARARPLAPRCLLLRREPTERERRVRLGYHRYARRPNLAPARPTRSRTNFSLSSFASLSVRAPSTGYKRIVTRNDLGATQNLRLGRFFSSFSRRLLSLTIVARIPREKEYTRAEYRAGPPNVNDPSAGSPTETLLRLLLPLNDQVWSSSRQHRQCRGTAAHQSEDLTKSFNR